MDESRLVRFSVRWSKGARVMQLIMFVFFSALALGWALLVFSPTIPWQPAPAATIWGTRSFLLLFLGPPLLMLRLYRFGIWLDGPHLVRQGAFLRLRVDLRTATFEMTLTSWERTQRFGPASFAKVGIRAPTLVVRAARLGRIRRIKLSLARRDVRLTATGGYVADWLPAGELEALAAAIEAHAGAPKVVRFLRNIDRSPVKPSAYFDNPF
jgi:hypothetical protein